jgi:hypothetical protein
MNADQILDAARAHFDRLRGQTVEVPEWGLTGESAATYDPPTLKIRQLIQHQAGKSDARLSALTVIHCLKGKDGKRIFANDAPTLAAFETAMDPAVIGRVAGRILSGSTDSDLGN